MIYENSFFFLIDNSKITLVSESEKEYVVSLHIIKTWGRSYFCHSDLHAKLYEVGTEMGF